MFKAITRGVRVMAGGVVAVTLTLTAPAYAEAGAVYGGSTSAHEPIVLRADRAGQRLRSAVMTWEAKCDQGAMFPFAAELRAVMLSRGFSHDAFELATSRNAKGRFAGTQSASFQIDAGTVIVAVTFAGTLRAGSASGMLSADVVLLDESGNEFDTCHTGATRWNASRSPGRLFAGKTSQDEPIVLRLDAKRRNVRNVLVGWQTASCQPEAFGRFPENLTNLPLRGGRFGDSSESSYAEPEGGNLRYTIELAGEVTRRSANGTLQATITGTDGAGATTLSCDSGGVTWKTATG